LEESRPNHANHAVHAVSRIVTATKFLLATLRRQEYGE